MCAQKKFKGPKKRPFRGLSMPGRGETCAKRLQVQLLIYAGTRNACSISRLTYKRERQKVI